MALRNSSITYKSRISVDYEYESKITDVQQGTHNIAYFIDYFSNSMMATATRSC